MLCGEKHISANLNGPWLISNRYHSWPLRGVISVQDCAGAFIFSMTFALRLVGLVRGCY
eukprot:jgi/Botrbrau1/7611/Bobra.0159s0060.1